KSLLTRTDIGRTLGSTEVSRMEQATHRAKRKKTAAHGSKLYRFDARLNEEQKVLIQRAADLEGRTMTDFVLHSAERAAERTIEERAMLILSAHETEAFVDAILRPAEPGTVLRAAARRYKQSLGHYVEALAGFPYTFEPLGDHDRMSFSCGTPELDDYLHHQAGQDAKRKVAAPFVMVDQERRILGYYTLSAYSVRAAELPPELAKKLPKY